MDGQGDDEVAAAAAIAQQQQQQQFGLQAPPQIGPVTLLENISQRQFEISGLLAEIHNRSGKRKLNDSLESKIQHLLERCEQVSVEFGLNVVPSKLSSFRRSYGKALSKRGSKKSESKNIYDNIEGVIDEYTTAFSLHHRTLNRAVQEAVEQ